MTANIVDCDITCLTPTSKRYPQCFAALQYQDQLRCPRMAACGPGQPSSSPLRGSSRRSVPFPRRRSANRSGDCGSSNTCRRSPRLLPWIFKAHSGRLACEALVEFLKPWQYNADVYEDGSTRLWPQQDLQLPEMQSN